MTNQDITVALEERTVVRKGLNKLRHEGKIPAVIHDHGNESAHVMGDYAEIAKVFSEAGKHHPVQIKIGGQQRLAMIKDVDLEPAKRRIRHIVFQAIKSNEKVNTEVPIVLQGDEIPAQKASLLVLTQLDAVEVEAFPRDLPSQIFVDATVLAVVGDRLHVSDLIVPEGVTIMTDPETQIAVVEMPRDQIAEADASAADLAADAGDTSAGEEKTVEIVGESSDDKASAENDKKGTN